MANGGQFSSSPGFPPMPQVTLITGHSPYSLGQHATTSPPSSPVCNQLFSQAQGPASLHFTTSNFVSPTSPHEGMTGSPANTSTRVAYKMQTSATMLDEHVYSSHST